MTKKKQRNTQKQEPQFCIKTGRGKKCPTSLRGLSFLNVIFKSQKPVSMDELTNVTFDKEMNIRTFLFTSSAVFPF